MESIADRLVFFILGCVFGTGFGYLLSFMRCIKGEVDEILDIEHKREEDEGGFMERRWAVNIAYAFSLLLVLYAAAMSYTTAQKLEEEVRAKTVAVCLGQEDVRSVQRDLVDQIYILATGAIAVDPENPPTETEFEQINAYIDRVNNFRTEMYQRIKPTEACVPYVEDDSVDPPTPDFPHIKRQR